IKKQRLGKLAAPPASYGKSSTLEPILRLPRLDGAHMPEGVRIALWVMPGRITPLQAHTSVWKWPRGALFVQFASGFEYLWNGLSLGVIELHFKPHSDGIGPGRKAENRAGATKVEFIRLRHLVSTISREPS